MIDERFTKNSDELESLRAELLSKKFDESNYNNVSMIRTLDKTIKERDLKIKELESRIRYLEGNAVSSASANSANKDSQVQMQIKQKSEQIPIAAKEINEKPVQELIPVAAPVIATESVKTEADKFKDAPRIIDADGDVVIAVSAKRSRSKTDKKKAEPASIVSEVSSAPEEPAVVEEKPKKAVRKIKKASKVEKEEEPNAETVVSEPVVPEPAGEEVKVDANDINDAIEAQRLADEEVMRRAEEEATAEAAESERIAKEQRLADEEDKAKAKAAAAVAELEKKKKTEVVKKSVIGKKEPKDIKDTKDITKKITSKTASASSSTIAEVNPPQSSKTKEANKETPKEKLKVASKVKTEYPDKLPELEDLDVITVSSEDYYCDKNNKAVYQMINGDDVGAFMGYYDSESETITPVDS